MSSTSSSRKKRHDSNEGRSEYDEHVRCYICGQEADFIVQLQLVKERSNQNIVDSINHMPFFLCKEHEHLYKRMRNNIDLGDYFAETIKENQ
jgi:hypothetical protein